MDKGVEFIVLPGGGLAAGSRPVRAEQVLDPAPEPHDVPGHAPALDHAANPGLEPFAERWEAGANEVIRSREVPWHVTRLGARAEYHFMPRPPRTGAEQWANGDSELERFLHLWAMNRGVLMTPFHNMALMSPATTEADVDAHTAVFADAVDALFG